MARTFVATMHILSCSTKPLLLFIVNSPSATSKMYVEKFERCIVAIRTQLSLWCSKLYQVRAYAASRLLCGSGVRPVSTRLHVWLQSAQTKETCMLYYTLHAFLKVLFLSSPWKSAFDMSWEHEMNDHCKFYCYEAENRFVTLSVSLRYFSLKCICK